MTPNETSSEQKGFEYQQLESCHNVEETHFSLFSPHALLLCHVVERSQPWNDFKRNGFKGYLKT